MPARVNALAVSLELTLVLLGLVLLWRLALSPAARARRSPPALAPWEAPLLDFFLFLWFIVCGGLVAQFAAVVLLKRFVLDDGEKIIFASAAFDLGMLAGIVFFLRGFSRRELPSTPPTAPPANALLSGAATFLMAMPLVFAVGLTWQFLLQLCGLPAEPQDLIARFAHEKSRAFLAVMIVVATVIAPVTEELIFRAGIFRYARTRLPRWAALLAPACLFGALHQNLASFAQLVALGIIFSLAYERTGRIGTSIVAHGLFNLHTIVLLLLGVDL